MYPDDSSPPEGLAAALPRILVLDDEPMLREFVTRCLGAAGYEVVTLSPAHGAVEFVTEARFDLLITNSIMPAQAGAQLVARLRRPFPALPMLHLDDQSHPRGAEFPATVPTLNKPFSNGALQRCVAQLLGQ